MLTREENELLCRVEGEAPMGQLMRRHWLPACLIEEVPDADGTPVAIRLLGEDLVAFRDSDGRVGVMDRYCPHRHASLVFGRNEDCGLRCLYHGWKIDVEGNVVEMPSEPAAACAAQKVRHTAYPTHEHGGFVWAYMGPKEAMPAFAPPPWAPTAATRVSIVKIAVDCNWAQILEGAIDSAPQLDAAFDRNAAGARRRRQGDRAALAAAFDRQGAADAAAADRLRLQVCGGAPADPERGHARLRAHLGIRRRPRRC